ncbi:hypothetical protein Ddye_030580 [Dipteronia dyeriana]|uniref:Uncharacterized protein n=1 Tax=Dipteronia dyeriana TaxID=168575 RepID=A0AAD9TH76_9ROSI|nr:hypothetical protein Ddye_030580 [Dipteronia dyeriana]
MLGFVKSEESLKEEDRNMNHVTPTMEVHKGFPRYRPLQEEGDVHYSILSGSSQSFTVVQTTVTTKFVRIRKSWSGRKVFLYGFWLP